MMRFLSSSILLIACAPVLHATPPLPCIERYAAYDEAALLTCVAPVPYTLPPIVAAPGTLRAVFPFPVPGVPHGNYSSGDFFVVDVSAIGQQFVERGRCSNNGDPEVIAFDAEHAFHVICQDEDAVVDLRLAGTRFEQAREPLQITPGRVLAVAYPDGAVPFVFYQRGGPEDQIHQPGALVARRWAPGSRTIPLTRASGLPVKAAPTSVIVEGAHVRVVVGPFDGASTASASYDLAELHDDDPPQLTRLALVQEPATNACLDGTWTTRSEERVVIHSPGEAPTGGWATFTVAVDGRDAAGPTLDVRGADLCT